MTLDEQYQKIIDDQRTYLLKLQDDFNKACDASKDKALTALKGIPESDKESREEVLKTQKVELTAALHTLKTEVEHSTKETMKKLEGIVTEKEKKILADLEQQMASL